MTAELTLEARRQLVVDHPVIRREFCIATPAIQRASDLTLHAIYMGKPALAMEAPPRFGKTTTCEYLSRKIQEEAFPTAATIVFNAQHAGSSHSPSQFYRELQFQSKVVKAPGQSAETFGAKVKRAWWARATEHGKNRLIFFCDEGQRLNESEFRWLIDIFNYEREQRVLFTSIFVCQPDIHHRRNSFIHSGCTDIVFRFMPTVHSFSGALSQQELEMILSPYDDASQLEYPSGSGICYTRFFFPQAYAQGWRLKKQARHMWKAFHPDHFRPDPRGIGMEWVSGAIQHVLSANMDQDNPTFDLTPDHWNQAVKSLGYFDVYDFVRSGSVDDAR